MARRPYKIARQEHLGNQLNKLQHHGVLLWRWDYDVERKRAIYHISLDEGATYKALGTKKAEEIAQEKSDALGLLWRPVPHPGGERERREVDAWLRFAEEDAAGF